MSFPHTARIQYPNLTTIRNPLSLFFSLDQNPLLRCKIHHFNLLNPFISHQSKPIIISQTSLSSFLIVKTLQQTPSFFFCTRKKLIVNSHNNLPLHNRPTTRSWLNSHQIHPKIHPFLTWNHNLQVWKKKLPKNLNHHHNPKNQVFLCFFIG